jgi:hypothetical protein
MTFLTTKKETIPTAVNSPKPNVAAPQQASSSEIEDEDDDLPF